MMEDGSRREGIITDVPMMVYEFNSVVVTNVAAPEFSHENINKVSFVFYSKNEREERKQKWQSFWLEIRLKWPKV